MSTNLIYCTISFIEIFQLEVISRCLMHSRMSLELVLLASTLLGTLVSQCNGLEGCGQGIIKLLSVQFIGHGL